MEEASPMIERCLGPICSGIAPHGVRSEGASVLLLEAEAHLQRIRGRKVAAQTGSFGQTLKRMKEWIVGNF